MNLSFVVAASTNNVIGKNNNLLWHLPNDMKYFKNVTWGMPVLMGRKTFESFAGKLLTGRANIILTRKKNYAPEGAVIVHKIEDALFFAAQNDYKEIMVIGGGEIYEMLLPKVHKIFLTRVHETFIDGDTFFPSIDEKKWSLASREDHSADEKHRYGYSFEVWTRK